MAAHKPESPGVEVTHKLLVDREKTYLDKRHHKALLPVVAKLGLPNRMQQVQIMRLKLQADEDYEAGNINAALYYQTQIKCMAALGRLAKEAEETHGPGPVLHVHLHKQAPEEGPGDLLTVS